ncbi:uncharacterized protein LOC120358421 [Solenopsis invicta]|uniref:uncharacterized protein LOC120358421 n=1 Tax=Solenopsis invicta TaxID=13686 RepID=UPI00193E890D|nr:uncharacterized protein LOC120358421 [Solenopsis invicta]
MPTDNEGETQGNAGGNSAHIFSGRIAKLPPFWKEEPDLWFLQVEAAFGIAGIVRDETKYQYIIAHADPLFLPHITSLLRQPPAENKYETLKQRVLGAFTESEEVKLRKVLQGQQLGESKPTHFLQKIRNLAPVHVSDSIIKSMFLEQMPHQLRQILVANTDQDLDALTALADKLMEFSNPARLVVQQVNQADSDSSTDSSLAAIIRRLDKIEARFTKAKRNNRSRSASRPRTSSESKQKSDKYCFYHHRFGENAQKCSPPCSWKQPTPKALEN